MSLPFAGAESRVARFSGSQSVSVALPDLSGVGEARRVAVALGTAAALGRSELSNLGIIVNEIAGNAARHGRGGEVLLRLVQAGAGTGAGVEALVLDRGPGMANVAECLRDGYSTSGTMGTGLGAARRLSQAFDIYSGAGQGTVVVARVWSDDGALAKQTARTGAVCLPVRGETECGDGWAAVSKGRRTVVMLVDGLGHGPSAAEAARTAVRLFYDHASRAPSDLLDLLHRGLRASRGAAAGVLEIDLAGACARFAGVGNIAGRIMTEAGTRSLVSQNGIVGHGVRRPQEFEYAWEADATVIMHSDGLTNHWKLDAYPGLLRRDPALLAAVLYRDFARERDDTVVVACRPIPAAARSAPLNA